MKSPAQIPLRPTEPEIDGYTNGLTDNSIHYIQDCVAHEHAVAVAAVRALNKLWDLLPDDELPEYRLIVKTLAAITASGWEE